MDTIEDHLNPKRREVGFYWVRLKHQEEPFVAEYTHQENDLWADGKKAGLLRSYGWSRPLSKLDHAEDDSLVGEQDVVVLSERLVPPV